MLYFVPICIRIKQPNRQPLSGCLGQRFYGTLQNLCFSSFAFLLCLAKLQVIYNGITCNSRRAFSLQHVLFTYSLLTEPAPLALFDVNRLLYYKPAPFSILFQYVNFACAIPLNCVAKVVQIFGTCKHFNEKMSIL